jgi:hypothetical protein
MAIIKTKFSRGVEGTTNIVDAGTEGTKVASGTTGQRGSTTGQFRFNSTINKFEGRNSSGSFVSLEQTPTISSINDTEVDSGAGGNQTFVITGTNFLTGDVASFVGSDGTTITASTTTIDSGTQITAVIAKSSFVNSKEPYDVKITSAGGLVATLDNQINVDNSPSWSTAAGSLGTVFDSVRSTASLSATATDPDSDTIVYSVQSGSLPAGASLNTSTGAITGFSAVGSDTTSSFTLRATANSKTADRAFSIVVKAPVTQAYAYTGSLQTFSIPSGVTSIQAKVWGAAGAGHNEYYSQSGGAGGFGIGTINVTGISSLNIVVGQGGQNRNTPASGSVGSSNKIATYGHLVAASTGENGGWGNVGGTGGGLSGIFNGAVTSQSNAIAIAGGGGAAGSVSGEGQSVGQGGYGGGFNQNAGSGGVNASASHGRPGTTSAGGDNGTVHFTRSAASGYTTANGGALVGGHGNTQTDGSSEGGGGGSGYFGGGAGTHGAGGGTWASGAGGSGYANTSLVSSITAANAGSAGATNSTATSDSNWASGIGVPVAGDNDGGHGRVVIIY